MKTNVRFEAAAVLIVALLGSTTTANADQRDKKQAKLHARKAAKLFEDKSYELALEEFQKAYDIFPVAALLYNMGQCHLFLGEHEKAIERFEAFLAEKPNTPYRDDVEKLIAEAQAELEKARKAREVESPPIEPPAVEPPPPPPPPVVTAPPPPPPVEEDDPVYAEWWFWTIIGGVAVAAGGTAIALTSGGETTTVLPMGDLGVLDRR